MSSKKKIWAAFTVIGTVAFWFFRELTKELVFGWTSKQLGDLFGDDVTVFLANSATWLGPIIVVALAMALTVAAMRHWPVMAGSNFSGPEGTERVAPEQYSYSEQDGWEFEHWDGVDPLSMTQAAYLWAGMEPASPVRLKGAGRARYITLSQAINDKTLTPIPPPLYLAQKVRIGKASEVPHLEISREELRRFIDEKELRPAPFVFPEDR